jgi:hypothetical protein
MSKIRRKIRIMKKIKSTIKIRRRISTDAPQA